MRVVMNEVKDEWRRRGGRGRKMERKGEKGVAVDKEAMMTISIIGGDEEGKEKEERGEESKWIAGPVTLTYLASDVAASTATLAAVLEQVAVSNEKIRWNDSDEDKER
ncbi:hypothetical protein GOBAR_AA08486 [Gossypium barbadense]|uniref:Uncharacterized protein n=1 Tax=Gossypium barbadense TaxID=3634 RepID=A0A2P5Y988_GOSBA|nr:hypothetical protein GOBAR_AA08486 [Gossypium barbadense]